MGSCSGLCSKLNIEKPIVVDVTELEVIENALGEEYYHLSA
jgi:hypothetical protein